MIRFHKDVAKQIEKLSLKLKLQVVESLDLLAAGLSIKMPLSRPMSDIAHGVHELRINQGNIEYFITPNLKIYYWYFIFLRKRHQNCH